MIQADLEFQLADSVVAYLQSAISDETQEEAPIVAFYDPRAVEDSHRIVVMVPNGESSAGIGCCSCDVVVEVRSRWSQPTIGADFAAHRERIKEVRSAFEADAAELCALLTTDGIGVDGFSLERQFKTDVSADNWIVSETGYKVNCWTKSE